MGYPVVIKPYNGNHGRGVTLNIMNREQVEVAVEVAKQHARTLVVEDTLRL